MSLRNFNKEIPGQITVRDVSDAATENEWGEATVTTTSGEYWSIVYDAEKTCFSLTIEPGIDKLELNNIFIDTTEPVEITEYSDFDRLQELVESHDEMYVTLHTSGVEWNKITAANKDLTDENGIPYKDVYSKLRDEEITVNATVKYTNITTNTSIEDVISVINVIRETMSDYGLKTSK